MNPVVTYLPKKPTLKTGSNACFQHLAAARAGQLRSVERVEPVGTIFSRAFCCLCVRRLLCFLSGVLAGSLVGITRVMSLGLYGVRLAGAVLAWARAFSDTRRGLVSPGLGIIVFVLIFLTIWQLAAADQRSA